MKPNSKRENYERLIKLIDDSSLGHVYDMLNNDYGYNCQKVDKLLEELKSSLEALLEDEGQ